MTTLTLRVIRDEHASLSAMLQSLRMMLKMGPGNHPENFFEVMRAMLFYIEEVPEQQHHPIESSVLFPVVAERAPEAREAITRLDIEHQKGEEAVMRLQHELMAWELLGETRRADFETHLTRYLGFYEDHMRLEEDVVLPAAKKHLSDADWAAIDAEFARNYDPLGRLLGGAPASALDPQYQHLFNRIASLAPPPVGLGDE